MNLGTLLIVGKSLFGNRAAAGYRLNRRAGLPKFNEGKNPFAPKTAVPAVAEEDGKVAVQAPAPGPQAPPPYAFKPVRSGARLVEPLGAKPARPGWTARLNPFRAAEPVAAQSPAAVQAELSLNSVKVVHNDLTDADVEVVPAKSRGDGAVAPPVLPPARRAWEYVGENLLKS